MIATVIAGLSAVITLITPIVPPALVPSTIPVSVVPLVSMIPMVPRIPGVPCVPRIPGVPCVPVIPAVSALSTAISVFLARRPVVALRRAILGKTILVRSILTLLREVVIGELLYFGLSMCIVAVCGGAWALAILEGNAESSFLEIRQSPQFLLAVGEGAFFAFLTQALPKGSLTLSKSGQMRVLKWERSSSLR
jgi:hypothetical protein